MWPLELLHDSAWQPLTWTLLHFLWQGILVAMIWIVLFRLFHAKKTHLQYLLGILGVFVMAVCPVATLIYLETGAAQGGQSHFRGENVEGRDKALLAAKIGTVPDVPLDMAMPEVSEGVLTSELDLDPLSNMPAVGSEEVSWRVEWNRWIEDVQPYLLGGWIFGMAVLSGRLLLGVLGVHRLRRSRQAVSGEWAARAKKLAARMGLRKVPGLFLSGAAREAVVTGLLRPIVLLPIAWLGEMTPEVLEAVIAHELAHIRRFDLWVNLFQRIVEMLLFYHPAVWWLSRRVRIAREMCCDELAAFATGDRVVYATALELAARKRLAPTRTFLEVALGVTRMTLLNRVRNVLGLAARGEQGRWWPAAVLVLLAPLALWCVSMAAVTTAQEDQKAEATDEVAPRGGGSSTATPTEAEATDKADSRGGVSPAAAPTVAAPAAPNDAPKRQVLYAIVGGIKSLAHGKYTATAILRISMQEKPMNSDMATDRDRFEIYKNTQEQLLRSRFLLQAALRKPEVAKLPSIVSAKKDGYDPVNWLSRRIEVSFPGKAEIMAVSLSGDDPKECAALVNAVVDSYLSDVVNLEQDRKRSRLSELERICAEKELDIRQKRQVYKNIAENSGTGDSETLSIKTKLMLEELSLYRSESVKTQSEMRRIYGELAAQKALLENAESTEVPVAELDQMVQSDPQAKQLGIELGKKIALIYGDERPDSELKTQDADRHRKELKTLQEQYDQRVESIQKKIQQSRRQTIAKEVLRLQTLLSTMQQQQDSVAKEITKMQSQVEKIGTSTVEVEMLRSDLKHQEASLAELAAERDKVRVSLRDAPRISLLEKAEAVEN